MQNAYTVNCIQTFPAICWAWKYSHAVLEMSKFRRNAGYSMWSQEPIAIKCARTRKKAHTHTHTLNVYSKWTGCKLAIKSKVRRGKTKHVNDFHEYNSSYFGTLIFGLIYHTSWERILYRASKSCTPKNKTPLPLKQRRIRISRTLAGQLCFLLLWSNLLGRFSF